MLETFAFDVCHDVYQAAREVIDEKIPTLNVECSGRYLWRPDRTPRLAEYVCDFTLAGERALGVDRANEKGNGKQQPDACSTVFSRASRVAMFRIYYLGGADYPSARRHLGISERTWADWADEIRRVVGRELTRSGVFPPSRYFREQTARAS
jgi:hypothetical protein